MGGDEIFVLKVPFVLGDTSRLFEGRFPVDLDSVSLLPGEVPTTDRHQERDHQKQQQASGLWNVP